MKKLLLSLMICFAALFFCAIGASAEAADMPSAEIAAKNVSYADSVKMIFAIEAQNYDKAEMQFFTEDTTMFTDENVTYAVKNYVPITIGGKDAIAFYSNGISAKNMAESYFVRVKVTKGSDVAYSEIQRYGVVQYLYERLADESATADQIELYHNLLNYGASAQKVLNYRKDRLASDDFFYVTAENSTYCDGEIKTE